MEDFKVENILLENTRQFNTARALYVRSGCPVDTDPDGIWTLYGPGSFDFTTFFNGLSVVKYDRYTIAQSYCLHIELRGAALAYEQTCADTYDFLPRLQERTKQDLPESPDWVAYDFELSYEEKDAICGFVLSCNGEVQIRNAYYVARVDGTKKRPVELALSTTTFKKEAYVTHNIELVKTKILGSNDPIASHFRMYVIDNGRTLNAEALSDNGVTVFPNANVGGAGGFAYGMIQALDSDEVTNILLMDDDVEVSPESIKRTYQLLTILNDDYAEAFVSGAMMNYSEPDVHWEDIGFMTEAGTCASYKPVLTMSKLHDCVTSETYKADEEGFGDLQQKYCAWWYCCIPISVIKKNGMPLPFFVRFDDAEYGLRCRPKIMTINGICIWHEAFFMRYNAAAERYQTMRNGFILRAITNAAPLTNFLTELHHIMLMELVKFNYTDAELALDGFEDFLRGPDFFMQEGVAEQTFMAANKKKEKLIPFEDLRQPVLQEFGIDIYKMCADDVLRSYPMGRTIHGRAYNVYTTQLFERSLNGQLFGDLKPFDGKPVEVIEAVGGSYQPGKLYGKDSLIALNIQNKAGIVRHRDNVRARSIWHRYQQDLHRYHQSKQEIEAAYADIRSVVTSEKYWKDYLGI